MTTRHTEYTALVLAGGQSSRMGTNKALLQANPGGPTLIETVIDRVREAGAQEILILAESRGPYKFLGIPIVDDAIKGAGPLGGIVGGLHASTCERNFVVACDMPNINPHLVQYMTSLTGEYEAVVPRWVDSTGAVHVEPLHAIYSRDALPKLEVCAAAGIFALRACLLKLRAFYIEEKELDPFGNPASLFLNMNRPEDWSFFATRERGKG